MLHPKPGTRTTARGSVVEQAGPIDEVVRLARAMTFEERIRSHTLETLERARAGHLRPRQAAIQITRVRIEEAMRYRGH